MSETVLVVVTLWKEPIVTSFAVSTLQVIKLQFPPWLPIPKPHWDHSSTHLFHAINPVQSMESILHSTMRNKFFIRTSQAVNGKSVLCSGVKNNLNKFLMHKQLGNKIGIYINITFPALLLGISVVQWYLCVLYLIPAWSLLQTVISLF